MADQSEAKDQLLKPGFGHREPEEELGRVGRRRGEGVVEGVVGLVELLVDELAADLMLVGQFGDGLAGEGGEGELLPHRGGEPTSWCGRGKDRGGRLR